MYKLFPHQQLLESAIYSEWASKNDVLAVLPTGGGKTVLFSKILRDHQGYSCAIVHRSELVAQISLALSRNEVEHRIIGASSLVKWCANLSVQETGKSFVRSNARCAVASVDTLVRRVDQLRTFLSSVTLWVQDEAHHVLRSNKWGKACELFTNPNCRGLGVTATPIRADGKGLGLHADGVFETLIEGASMRWLIDNGYLTNYRIFAPPANLGVDEIEVSKRTGDFNQDGLRMWSKDKRAMIVGDVVEQYRKIANGKLGVTFSVDVETATAIATQYNAAGIPAEIVSAKTSDQNRREILKRFANRELMQLVNVDLFGEGFDLPAIEVVSMARPTQSFSLYAQQFGRALRTMEGKTHAIIIDHVGNVTRHGLPDAQRTWSLDAREKRPSKVDPDLMPVRVCPECAGVYEAFNKICPFCDYYPEPAGRSLPEQVDGDLTELTPEVLAKMRGEKERIDAPADNVKHQMLRAGAPRVAAHSAAKAHAARQDEQTKLRDMIALWAGIQVEKGFDKSQQMRRFYHLFGVDIMTAQTFGKPDAQKLNKKLMEVIEYDYCKLSPR